MKKSKWIFLKSAKKSIYRESENESAAKYENQNQKQIYGRRREFVKSI